jgi:hypothetical protein
VTPPPKKTFQDLQPGDTICVQLNEKTKNHVVSAKTLQKLGWLEPYIGTSAAEQIFKFEESKLSVGGTTFTHEKERNGELVSATMEIEKWRGGWFGKRQWRNTLMKDLKAFCEGEEKGVVM